jgi:ketosteroid isomerase-like protein
LVVAATALVTVVVLGLTGLGIWLATRGGRPETSRVNNARPENSTINANTRPIASPTPSPSATPTVSPTQNIDKARITKDVRDQIDSWVDNTESFDADALMHNYADRVDYFRTGSATKQQIWEDKQRAFEKFDTIRFDISNVKIDVDPSGDTATAEFDKAWVFEGETTSKGKVRSQLRFRNFGGRWLITSEKDLKVY